MLLLVHCLLFNIAILVLHMELAGYVLWSSSDSGIAIVLFKPHHVRLQVSHDNKVYNLFSDKEGKRQATFVGKFEDLRTYKISTLGGIPIEELEKASNKALGRDFTAFVVPAEPGKEPLASDFYKVRCFKLMMARLRHHELPITIALHLIVYPLCEICRLCLWKIQANSQGCTWY